MSLEPVYSLQTATWWLTHSAHFCEGGLCQDPNVTFTVNSQMFLQSTGINWEEEETEKTHVKWLTSLKVVTVLRWGLMQRCSAGVKDQPLKVAFIFCHLEEATWLALRPNEPVCFCCLSDSLTGLWQKIQQPQCVDASWYSGLWMQTLCGPCRHMNSRIWTFCPVRSSVWHLIKAIHDANNTVANKSIGN